MKNVAILQNVAEMIDMSMQEEVYRPLNLNGMDVLYDFNTYNEGFPDSDDRLNLI